MKFFSYVITRDYGFAPNPFNGVCTLATCKPDIRNKAVVGDWIFGTGSASQGCRDRLVYAMKVSEKLTFNQYWQDERFACKKAVMNGSLKTMYGDNIYYYDAKKKKWLQADSHHSLDDGTVNKVNLKKDTKANAVLISNYFFYFGKNCIKIPSNLVEEICKMGPGFKYVDSLKAKLFLKYLESKSSHGYHGDPKLFDRFARFPG